MIAASSERRVARDDEGYPVPLVMADCAIFALKDGRLHLLAPRREKAPEKGKRALVGGRLHVGVGEDESPEAAARRIAREKVGLDVRYLEQFYTFGGQYRETVWTVTVAYLALLGEDSVPDHLHPDLHPVADPGAHWSADRSLGNHLVRRMLPCSNSGSNSGHRFNSGPAKPSDRIGMAR